MSRAEAVETFTENGRKVTIYVDPEPSDPRECDNLATLTCCHRRYKLGDERHVEPMTEAELREHVGEDKILAVLPLYLFDHGGITMRTTPFGDRWDSGQVGWAYVTRERAEAMGCVGAYGEGGGTWDQARYEQAIRDEVEEYDHYLTGHCYGFVVKGRDGDTLEDGWGFLGDVENCRQEARSAAKHCDDPAIDRMAEELASRATFAAGEGAIEVETEIDPAVEPITWTDEQLSDLATRADALAAPVREARKGNVMAKTLTHRNELLQQVAAGLNKLESAPIALVTVTIKTDGDDDEYTFGLAQFLDVLANDLTWDERGDWSDARLAVVGVIS